MTNILKIPLNKIRQEGNYKELLDAIERGFNRFSIDYYLVGATARDVWMRGIHEVTPKRATSDLDFAVMLKNSEQFEELKKYLIEVEGFVPYKENAFVLIWKDQTQVDLIPFGDLEKEGIVTVKGTGFTSMNVEGIREVFEEASAEIQIDDNKQFKVCTLSGIVILKLIAWDDRPEARGDDIDDIADILRNYFRFNSEAIWEKHFDLFVDDVGLDEIASQYLGREIGRIVAKNPKLKDRILDILTRGISDEKSNKLDELLA
ncbi:MAG: nucleotidyl transferase AbiEii/AbiGii toxin family protein, partial [Bacteroidales bacterium]